MEPMKLTIDTNDIEIIESKQKKEKTLIRTIQLYILGKIEIDFYINPDLLRIVNYLIDNDNHVFFENIEKCLRNITYDNKIDSKDIPDILKLLESTYLLILKLKKMKFTKKAGIYNAGELLKLVIKILIMEHKVEVAKTNKIQYINQFNHLVDTTISLMMLPIETQKLNKCLKQTIKNCFKCFV